MKTQIYEQLAMQYLSPKDMHISEAKKIDEILGTIPATTRPIILSILQKKYMLEHPELCWEKEILENSYGPNWYFKITEENKEKMPCKDHIHKTKKGNMLSSQPYNANMTEVKKLVEFCEKHNLDFRISGGSVHFPNRCFTILLWKMPKGAKRLLESEHFPI